jgi:predicted membrane protein
MMKKTLLGAGLILLAAYILFRDAFLWPTWGLPLWTLLFVLGFGYGAVQNALRRNYTSAYVCGVIALIILERHYGWLNVGTGTLVLAAVLAGIGLGMIFKPVMFRFDYKFNSEGDQIVGGDFVGEKGNDTVFGNSTRYINDENLTKVTGNLVFSGSSIYFANATIQGGEAIYSGDAVFSNVKLFVPKDWNVEFAGERVFSSIKTYPNHNPGGKTLVITGEYVFSNLEVFYI